MSAENLELMQRKLEAAFPAVVVSGTIAPHDCIECDKLRKQLSNITWRDVPAEFVAEHDADLPLLSKEAYKAFLPAWLLAGIRDPDGPNAAMLMVNLGNDPDTGSFTKQQASVIVEAAEFMATNSVFGREDPVHIEAIAQIRSAWNFADSTI
jgi:hypothetical protein